MSVEYDQYLERHKNNVKKGFDWISENLPELIEGTDNLGWQIGMAHDWSKSEPEEYAAYDAYFYGGNRSYAVVRDFKIAWLRHIHKNPHHWQHWVLINDEPGEGEICLEMPYNYILEMICDWWAFSWTDGNLGEIFDWYEKHKDYIKFHENTRKTVEDILEKIMDKLDESEQLCHHGIKGQKWGERNGPPYPLEERSKTKGEADVIKQRSASLRKGIRSLQAKIIEHESKIKDPAACYPAWNTFTDVHKDRLIKHWKKEISDFQDSIETRIDELKKRGEYDE